jgi:N-acyl-D-amino-acid deacylase
MFDLLIQDGTIVDGTGSARQKADIGIIDGRIEAIGNLTGADAGQILSAQNLVVAPGFIDVHSHADYVLPVLPTADSKVHQGVTFEMVGNCGASPSPLSSQFRQAAIDNTLLGGGMPIPWDWDTFESYFNRLRKTGTSVNVGALVGQGAIRTMVMGMSAAEPSVEQLDAMKAEVRKCMQAGAFGISSGLIYPPNVYAKTAEIIELATVVAEFGGIYTTHVRGEANTVLEAVDEAIQIGRSAGISVEISHLKAQLRPNWPKMAQLIKNIQTARDEGLDVNADMYPYNASNTTLTALLPDWAHVGGRAQLFKRLQNDSDRAKIFQVLHAVSVADNPSYWNRVKISFCTARPDYEGFSIQEIADQRGETPEDTVMNVLLEVNGNAEMVQFLMSEENVELGLQSKHVMIGTDGEGRVAEGPLSIGKPHPRNYGTFPRVLGYYARQQELFSLEEAIRKMTGLPAQKFGLQDRGLLKPGNWADLVVFDPNQVIDKSTFTQPHQYPVGINHVLVNGQFVILDGIHTGALPGQVVTHS